MKTFIGTMIEKKEKLEKEALKKFESELISVSDELLARGCTELTFTYDYDRPCIHVYADGDEDNEIIYLRFSSPFEIDAIINSITECGTRSTDEESLEPGCYRVEGFYIIWRIL